MDWVGEYQWKVDDFWKKFLVVVLFFSFFFITLSPQHSFHIKNDFSCAFSLVLKKCERKPRNGG